MEYNNAVSGVSLSDDHIVEPIAFMDHVGILSADTITLVSSFISETCKCKSIFEVWFYDLHVFSRFFYLVFARCQS